MSKKCFPGENEKDKKMAEDDAIEVNLVEEKATGESVSSTPDSASS